VGPPPLYLPHPSMTSTRAVTRLMLEAADVPALEHKFAAVRVRFISAGIVVLRDNQLALLIRNPDGHALLLLGR